MAQGLGAEVSSYKVLTMSGQDPAIEPYLGFIIGNWLTTLRQTNQWFGLIDEDAFYKTYNKFIHAILQRPSCQVSIAVIPETSDASVGWAVYESTVLHYCYVPRPGRNQGIAKSIVPKNIETITHLTTPGVVIWKKKYPKLIFNPFL